MLRYEQLQLMSIACVPTPYCREFADSKTLTPDKRDQLFEEISKDDCLGYIAEILSAQV